MHSLCVSWAQRFPWIPRDPDYHKGCPASLQWLSYLWGWYTELHPHSITLNPQGTYRRDSNTLPIFSSPLAFPALQSVYAEFLQPSRSYLITPTVALVQGNHEHGDCTSCIFQNYSLPLWHLVTFRDQILPLENTASATMVFLSSQRKRLDFWVRQI